MSLILVGIAISALALGASVWALLDTKGARKRALRNAPVNDALQCAAKYLGIHRRWVALYDSYPTPQRNLDIDETTVDMDSHYKSLELSIELIQDEQLEKILMNPPRRGNRVSRSDSWRNEQKVFVKAIHNRIIQLLLK